LNSQGPTSCCWNLWKFLFMMSELVDIGKLKLQTFLAGANDRPRMMLFDNSLKKMPFVCWTDWAACPIVMQPACAVHWRNLFCYLVILARLFLFSTWVQVVASFWCTFSVAPIHLCENPSHRAARSWDKKSPFGTTHLAEVRRISARIRDALSI